MTNTPRPIEENLIYREAVETRIKLKHVYEGRVPALLIDGPAGVGKSTLVKQVGAEYGEHVTFEHPGSAIGLTQLFYKYRNRRLLAIDESDFLWDTLATLLVLKIGLDTQKERIMSRTVGGGRSIPRFRINCGAVFTANRSFDDPKQFKLWPEVEVVRSRTMRSSFSNDPLALYEYTGWMATTGRLLANVAIDLPIGSTVLGKNGGPITITARNKHRKLNIEEANHVLDHFARYAPRYPVIGLRQLEIFARLHIGVSNEEWEQLIETELLKTPKWQLPETRYRYQVVP
jgi:DNA polymerase III delta prime subunit